MTFGHDLHRMRQPIVQTAAAATAALCGAVLVVGVSAEDPVTFHVPSSVTACQPINLTWTGGIPPYRLDVTLIFDNVPNITQDQRQTGILNTWTIWTPDYASAGSKLEVNVVGSGFSASSGGFMTVLPNSGTSCFDDTPTTTLTITLTASASTSTVTLSPSRAKLDKGAIGAVALGATLIGIGLIAFSAWYVLRRMKTRVRQSGAYSTPGSCYYSAPLCSALILIHRYDLSTMTDKPSRIE